MSDQRPIVYTEGEQVVYRASALGLPLRSLTAARLGYEPQAPPPIVRDAGREGTRLESEVKRLLGQPVFREQAEVGLRHRHTLVRGHIDGCVTAGLLEVKTCTDAGLAAWRVKRWEARPGWAWQVSAYCHALGLDRLLMAVFARDTGELDQWETEPPHDEGEVRHRLDTVEHWAARGELPLANPGYPGFDPYSYLHKLEAEGADELADVLAEYAALGTADKATAGRKAELKQRITFLMGDRPKVTAGFLEATFSRVSTERFDTEAFKRAYPDLFAKFLRTSESERLVVRAL